MTLLYVTSNLITSTTLDSVTSEDTTYVMEYLYNQRPSLPFRFTAKSGNQIKVDMGAATSVTLVAVLNHNLDSPTLFKIKAAAADPPAGGDWDNPDWSDDLALCTSMENSYLKISQSYRYWVLDIDDAGNSDNIQIGEFILSTHSNFGTGFHLMADTGGVSIPAASLKTPYGQPWDYYHSKARIFTLQNRQTTTLGSIDAIRTFLEDLEGAAGKFLLIPDDNYCQCYYVHPVGDQFPAASIYHANVHVKDWNLPLEELPMGITLL